MSSSEKLKKLARIYSHRYNLPYSKALQILRDKKIGLHIFEDILDNVTGDYYTLETVRNNLLRKLNVPVGPDPLFDKEMVYIPNYRVRGPFKTLKYKKRLKKFSAKTVSSAIEKILYQMKNQGLEAGTVYLDYDFFTQNASEPGNLFVPRHEANLEGCYLGWGYL